MNNMVNTPDGRPSTKAIILTRLRELAGEPISGELLAEHAGVSRVAVWKAAEALKEAGYAVGSGSDGYTLDPAAGDDYLYPWEFPDREARFRHWVRTESTMDRARELADRGGSGGTIAVAELQSAGRGRGGRSWSSEDGGLFFTILRDGGAAIQRYARSGMAVQLAVARAVAAVVGQQTLLRWPNDIYVRGRKVAGILTELRGEADRVRWISVGVGVNVNNAPPSERATSCAELAGHRLSRRQLLSSILNELEGPHGDARGDEALIGAWNANVEGKGAVVSVTDAAHGADGRDQAKFRGRFLGVDEYGRAILETERGTIELEAGAASLTFAPE